MSTDRVRNPRGEGTRLRDEILDAAIALLDDPGSTGALTLRGIARRAGISAPPIYTHFDDLASLVDAVLARSFDELRTSMNAASDGSGDGDPVRALEHAGLAYVTFGWRHPARYRLMFGAEGYATNAIDTFQLVQDLIAACISHGVSRSSNPKIDTWILWAGLHGVATLDKPARAEQRRLGVLDRPTMLRTMIHRLARLDEPGPVTPTVPI